jgi:hypothetical protein
MLTEADDAVERAVYALRLSEGLDPSWRRSAFQRFASSLIDGMSGWLGSRVRASPNKTAGLALTARGREVCDAAIRELL